MSSPVLLHEGLLGDDLSLAPTPAPPGPVLPADVTRNLLSGTSALTVGLLIERSSSFLANVLSARLAGATAFGAYSIAISTANNISTYAAGGIGSTAARFSGKYSYGTAGYTTLARALAIVSLVSAAVAVVALWFGAGPIAHLLNKPGLTHILRWASISAAGIILLECARGFFVGQRRLHALILLSVVVGVGMISLVPIAASFHRPTQMLISQGGITLAAVSVCLLLAAPLQLLPSATAPTALQSGPILKEVWSFGFVQLAGLITANLAGWWLVATVARADTTLVQTSFFTVASQLRNMTSLAPSLLTEGSYAVMADPEGEKAHTTHRVMALCMFGASAITLLIASAGMVLAPWAVAKIYGSDYRGSALAASLGLAVAVTHMGNAPASARLNILSIKAAGYIRAFWAVLVGAGATLLFFRGSNAAAAMAVFFVAHLVDSGLVLLVLSRKDQLPRGVFRLFLTSSTSILMLVGISVWRSRSADHETGLLLLTLAVAFAIAGVLYVIGKHYGWLPSRHAMKQLLTSSIHSAKAMLRRRGAGDTYAR